MKTLSVLAIVLTALTMSAGLAHVLEMAPKLRMDAMHYLATQQLYRGWAFIGAVFIAALAVNIALALHLRGANGGATSAAVGAGATACALAVFFALISIAIAVSRSTR